MNGTATSPRVDTDLATVPGWAVLAIAGSRLALPQREVQQFESASDVEAPGTDMTHAAGQFTAGSQQVWPVYSLDGSLGLQRAAVLAASSLCVFLEAQGQKLGLLCDRVWALAEDSDLAVEPLPGCLKGPPSPVTGLARFQDRITLVTDRDALWAYLSYLLGQPHVQ